MKQPLPGIEETLIGKILSNQLRFKEKMWATAKTRSRSARTRSLRLVIQRRKISTTMTIRLRS